MVLLMVALLSFFLCHSSELETYEVQFQQFVKEHNKNYVPGTTEYKRRFDIFVVSMYCFESFKSLKRIERLNTLRTHEESAIYGVTKFADLTPTEFEDRGMFEYTLAKFLLHYNVLMPTDKYLELRRLENEIENGLGLRRHKRDTYANDIVSKLPAKFPVRIDWRDKKVISPVRNQGKCGACWAYSTIETIEAMVAITTKKPLVELSVQQIIDCAAEDNHGCDGGDTCGALSWMSDYNVKIQTAADYPMRDDAGDCRAVSPKTGVQIYSNFTCNNYTGDEIEMVKLLAEHGPLVAAVDAASWQDYLGGIIQYHCETKRNHAVQIVGYDISGEIPYYIVRNTWGTEFGLDGYLRIAIGKNLCGIAEEISAVDVKE
ncbi:cathepsin O-like cysteine peptidase protein [Leptotrombidium deliense]|uniref:Cathepsin O-like cysteine peptidase protein n=1 Tax=Leptotrombidium deliense TaxID=299467 RepID=A0A443SQE0_9ACAR|nr:cathepsin O-like cysteine peptidase protein [Leptotrombidium deliense]